MLPHVAAVLVGYFVALGVGVSAVALNDWFGSGDLAVFAIYCGPFSFLAAAIAGMVFSLTEEWPVWLATPAAFVAGLLCGLLGTFAVALFLGPWFGAMSVPVLQVWCASAAFTSAASVLVRRTNFSVRTLWGVTAMAALSLMASVSIHPAYSLVTGDQHLSIVEVRYLPGEHELSFLGNRGHLETAELELLKKAGLRGTIENVSRLASNTTNWPRAKMLIVLLGPPSDDVSLPQPKRCTIVYIQEGNGFRRVPGDAPTQARQVHIEHTRAGWQLSVEQASGARSGGELGI